MNEEEARRVEMDEERRFNLTLNPDLAQFYQRSDNLNLDNDSTLWEASSWTFEEESTFIKYTEFLEFLYEDNAHFMLSEVFALNEQLDALPVKQIGLSKTKMTSPAEVVEQFLADLPLGDDSLSDADYKSRVDDFLNVVLDQNLDKEVRMLQLQSMANCIGDSPTSAQQFFTQHSSFITPEPDRISQESDSLHQEQESDLLNQTIDTAEESSIQTNESSSTSEEEKTFVPFNAFLVYLYGDEAAHEFSSAVYGLNTQLDPVIIEIFNSEKKEYENIMTSPSRVIEEFLAKAPIDDPLSELIFNPYLERLLTDVMDKSKGKDAQMLSLQTIATSLGNCTTPVKDFLIQIYVGECVKTKGKLSNFEEGIIEREALQKYILKELNSLLINNDEEVLDKIEQVNGLLLSIYEDNSEKDKRNPIPIKGFRERLPPKTDNIGFAYAQVKEKKDLIEAFAQRVCVTTPEGKPTKFRDGVYRIDKSKLRAISEKYLARLNHVSDREKLLDLYKKEMSELIKSSDHKHLSTEHYDNEEVERLTNIPERQKELRTLLLSVESTEIQKTYTAFFDKDKEELKRLSNELRETITINDEFSEAMVVAANKNNGTGDPKTKAQDSQEKKSSKTKTRRPSK